MAILITGGAGYIGSHTCVELLTAGKEIVVLDNFSNSKPEALRRVREIAGREFPVVVCDLLDQDGLDKVFDQYSIEAVVHFAGLKAVGESCRLPLLYYQNNITGTLNLCQAMERHDCRTLVFCSSATVYGDAKAPYTEQSRSGSGITNPYGWTKAMIEQILRDLAAADPRWSISLLRYFNPIGAHSSGRIGEDPNGIPNNLMPYIAQVAVGKLERLSVYGDDYDTPDGTGVRDYIHVVDLALGHLKALDALSGKTGVQTYNLGTGRGYSVLEVVRAFETASGRPVPYVIAPRRAGDLAVSYACVEKAEQELGWKAQRGIEEMCADSWRWQSQNPNGYPDEN